MVPADPLEVVLQTSIRRLGVDRVVALPGVDGQRIPGTTHNDAGFMLVGPTGACAVPTRAQRAPTA